MTAASVLKNQCLFHNAFAFSCFFLVQEAHGTERSFRMSTRFLEKRHQIFYSLGLRPGIGGLAAFVSIECLLHTAASVSVSNICPGRIARVVFAMEKLTSVIWNIHNEDLSASQMLLVSNRVECILKL